MELWDVCGSLHLTHSLNADRISTGSAAGGDTAEAVTEHASAAAGGRAEQPEGAAGGGRGGQEEPGETDEHHAGAGTQACKKTGKIKLVDIDNYRNHFVRIRQ